MAGNMTGTRTEQACTTYVSSLQNAAWALCNASYGAPDLELYREVGHALYRQSFSQRINSLFAWLDEQNRYLDTVLGRSAEP